MEFLILFAILCAFQGFIGYLIAKGKGRGKAGFWWSFFLGIIGWIIAASLEPSQQVQAQRMMTHARMMREAMRD